MVMISTTETGNRLEERIFSFFQSMIDADRFFAKSECCKLFRKKGYYSKDREKKIIFDVSIEVTLPGCEDYSVVVLIECKNYSHAVPVDDAEEFCSKLEQVGAANAKGIIASTANFQEGTLTYSRSKGIALLRYFDDTNFKWTLTRGNTFGDPVNSRRLISGEVITALISPTYRSAFHNFVGVTGGTRETSLRRFLLAVVDDVLSTSDVLREIINHDEPESLTVSFLSRDEIESQADAALREVAHSEGAVSLEAICAREASSSGLVFRKEPPSTSNGWAPGVLARIRFSPLEIVQYEDANWNVPRERFTLAHELGHHILGHADYMAQEYCEEEDFATCKDSELNQSNIGRLEWQANYFASCILLPRRHLTQDFVEMARNHDLQDKGHGLLYVDDQLCNQVAYRLITNALCAKYRVSRTVVKIRLENLGFLNDARGRLTRAWI